MSCNQNNKACPECPFSRKSTRGALGGSPIGTYLGQIIGPFFMPCHMARDYKGNDTPLSDKHAQCAGAAIMRANLKIGHLMPDPLLKLEHSSDPNVFDTLEEFILHHYPEATPESAKEMAKLAPAFYELELVRAAKKLNGIKSQAQAQKDYKS